MNLEQYNSWKDAEDFVQACLKKDKERIIRTSEGNFKYLEFNTEQTKEQFFENHKDIWYGIIYKAINIIDDKIYIGQTTQFLYKRKQQHLKGKDKGRFKNAINKYGEHFFEWEIIDYAKTPEKLDEKEKYWVKFYKSNDKAKGYNLTDGGKSSFVYKYTEEDHNNKMIRYVNKLYDTYPIEEILLFLNETLDIKNCQKIFNISYFTIRHFLKLYHKDLYDRCADFSQKIKGRRVSETKKTRTYNKAYNKIDLPLSVDELKILLEKHLSFVKVAKIINITSRVLISRLKEIDIKYFYETKKKVIQLRNIKNGVNANKNRKREI